MRALIGSFLVVFFLNWPASAHHQYDEGLSFLHNNSLVANNSIIVIFGLMVIVAFVMPLKRIRTSKTKA